MKHLTIIIQYCIVFNVEEVGNDLNISFSTQWRINMLNISCYYQQYQLLVTNHEDILKRIEIVLHSQIVRFHAHKNFTTRIIEHQTSKHAPEWQKTRFSRIQLPCPRACRQPARGRDAVAGAAVSSSPICIIMAL